MKVPVLVRKEYTVYFEEYGGFTWGHCDMHQWSPRIAKRLKGEWDVLRASHGGPIFAIHEIGDIKHAKWCRMFGFHYANTFTGDDGVKRDLYMNIQE
jgi:hypothetical protein